MDQLPDLLGKTEDSDDVIGFALKYDLVKDFETEEGYYVTAEKNGVDLFLEDGHTVGSIFLHDGSQKGYSAFPDLSDHDLSFDWNREDVREHFGHPASSCNEPYPYPPGPHAGWDAYVNPSHKIHFTYGYESGTVCLITISKLG